MTEHDTRKPVSPLIMVGGALVGLTAAMVAYVRWQINREPKHTPQQVAAQGLQRNGRLIVCLGDSLTRGRISADYVGLLRQRLGPQATVVNAGVNGDLVWNALQRLDEVTALRPDVVTVLLGTNDANAMLSEQSARMYVKDKSLPMWPTFNGFERHFRQLVQRLKAETDAHIMLLSLPMLGDEHPGTLSDHLQPYVDTILRVAYEEDVTYLPLFEAQMNALAKSETRPPRERVTLAESAIAAAKRYVLGRSWNRIGAEQGYLLLTDGIHLNERGAEMVTELIMEALT